MQHQQIGKYRIEQRIGGGGMGIVYKAFDSQLERTVALKFLRTNLTENASAKERLLIEARSAAQLDHPNICTIFEVGETPEGDLYLAMPFYEGQTLREVLEAGPLSIEKSLNYVRQIGKGLQRAHDAGIVHRDIKPANLLITPEETVKILDFGIAKRTEDHLTTDGSRLGTLAYMSPEQLQNEEVDHRTDVWALGIVLFELLTGERPFQGEYEYALMYALLQEDPVELSTALPDAPESIESTIKQALQKSKEDRLQSISEFLNGLDQPIPTTNNIPPAPEKPKMHIPAGGQRVQATVAVSAVSGYYDLAESISPNQLSTLMAQLEDEAKRIADQHNGILYRFGSEEIVLLFGITGTNEHDGVQAARAVQKLHLAFDAQQPSPEGMALATALSTGPCILQATEEGIDVTGKPLTLARRIAGQELENSILIDGEMARLLRAHFPIEEHGSLKGRRGSSITLFALGTEKAHASPMRGSIDRGLTTFTGRQRELDTILRSFDRIKHGEGQFVTLSGEAGLGKSRLSYEFRNSLKDEDITLLIGRCQTYSSRTPYLPFIEAIRMALGLDTLLAADIDADQVINTILSIGTDLEQMTPIYLDLLGLHHPSYPLPQFADPELYHRAILDSIMALLTTLSHQKPLVVILEDWHWADEESRRILNQLVEFISSYPILLLLPYRPSYIPNWGHPECHVPIRLRPLDASNIRSMILALLAIEEAPSTMVDLLMDRTEGNPFFLEELVISLLEGGIINVQDNQLIIKGDINHSSVPNTVHSVLRTRIQRLNQVERTALQAASVVGRSFTLKLLKSVLPAHELLDRNLDAIRKTGLLQQTKVIPELEFRFKHALIQEVAYDNLLGHQRKKLHGVVADAIEQLYPELAEEQPFRLATHLAEAEIWEKAVDYGKKAVQSAWMAIQYEKALELLHVLLTWLDRFENQEIAREERIRTLFLIDQLTEGFYFTEERQKTLERLNKEIEVTQNDHHICNYYLRRAELLDSVFNHKEAYVFYEKARDIAVRLDDNSLKRKTLRNLGWHYWYTDQPDKALELNKQALALISYDVDSDEALSLYINLATIATTINNLDKAADYLEEALALFEDSSLYLKVTLLFLKGRIEHLRGDTDLAIKTLESSMEIWNKGTFHYRDHFQKWTYARRSWPHMLLSTILMQLNQLDEAEKMFRQAIDFHQAAGIEDVEYADSLLAFGNFLLQNNKTDEGIQSLEKAANLYEQFDIKLRQLDAYTSLALAYEKADNFPGAFVMWEQLRSVGLEFSDEKAIYNALEGMARVARLQERDPQTIVGLYTQALDYARSKNATNKQADLHNTLGILAWGRADLTQSLMHFKEALHIFTELGDSVHRGLMLNSIGATYAKLGAFDEAIAGLEEAILVHDTTGEQRMKGHALATLGDVHRDQSNFDSALDRYGESLQIRWDIDDRLGEGWMLERIAGIHQHKGDLESARKGAQKALEIAQECGDPRLLEACKKLL